MSAKYAFCDKSTICHCCNKKITSGGCFLLDGLCFCSVECIKSYEGIKDDRQQ